MTATDATQPSRAMTVVDLEAQPYGTIVVADRPGIAYPWIKTKLAGTFVDDDGIEYPMADRWEAVNHSPRSSTALHEWMRGTPLLVLRRPGTSPLASLTPPTPDTGPTT